MDGLGRSTEQLIERIEELERLNRELLRQDELEVRLEYARTGNLGHWYWDTLTNSVTFNPLKVTALGYSREEIPEQVDYQFFADRLHPEDYERVMEAMRSHLHGNADVYETEYRIRTKDGNYRWYYDRGKITQFDGEGEAASSGGNSLRCDGKEEGGSRACGQKRDSCPDGRDGRADEDFQPPYIA